MIEKSSLFKRLKYLEEKEYSIGSSPISSKITEELIPQSRDILSRITQYLPEYTLHNIEHSYRVLKNIENILPPDVKLNIVEIKLLIYAVFLHDIGMTSDKLEEKLFQEFIKTEEEKKNIIIDRYVDTMRKNANLSEYNSQKFKELIFKELNFFKKEGESFKDKYDFSEYVRRRHVSRAELKLILMTSTLGFEHKHICLMNYIFTIILSHGLNFKELSNERRFPLDIIILDKNVNILYLSVLLRLGDLLDASISRTPRYIYSIFGFTNNVSISKWEKSLLLVGLQITNYRISFNYMSTKPKYEREIRKFIKFVEQQIFDSVKILKHSPLKINLSSSINLTVNNDGSYKSADKEITVEYDKIKKILMGVELYSEPKVFLRELIQNSRDACKMREYYVKEIGLGEYKPRILIKFDDITKKISSN